MKKETARWMRTIGAWLMFLGVYTLFTTVSHQAAETRVIIYSSFAIGIGICLLMAGADENRKGRR